MNAVCSARDSASRMKRQASSREKGLPTPSLGELVSRVLREHSKADSEKPNSSAGKWAESLNTEFSKAGWQISTREDVPHC